jgi:hypothetical protein
MRTNQVLKTLRAPRPFTPEEDAALMSLVRDSPEISWEQISMSMCGRSARQCRERYVNYLSPNIRTGQWTASEDLLLVEKVNQMGHRWATIGQCFGGRTESDVKNRWYSHLKFRVTQDERWGTFKLVEAEQTGAVRRKRARAAPSPKLKAEQLMRERSLQKLDEVVGGTEVFDKADAMSIWDLADDKIDFFAHSGLYDPLF